MLIFFVYLVTCWKRADLLALACDVQNCVFVTFPSGILGQVWYLIVSIPDLCRLSYLTSVFTGGIKGSCEGQEEVGRGIPRETRTSSAC